MQQLIQIFMFDVLIGNIDRHSTNLILLEDEDEHVRFSKIFDHEKMLSTLSIYGGGYSLGIDSDDYFVTEEDFDFDHHFLQKFLNIYPDIYFEQFQKNLKVISKESIDDVLTRVEKNIQTKIVTPIREKIQYQFGENYDMLNKILNIYINEKGMVL